MLHYMSLRICLTTFSHLLHFDTKHYYNSSPPPEGFVTEMFFFLCVYTTGEGLVGEGANCGGGGGGGGGRGAGWQTGDRPSSLSPPGICPLLPTPLLISSRPCAWQQRGFRISPSPRVKNPKPYHFVNGYL